MTKRELIERIKDFPDDAEVGLSLVKADGRSVYPDVSVERVLAGGGGASGPDYIVLEGRGEV